MADARHTLKADTWRRKCRDDSRQTTNREQGLEPWPKRTQGGQVADKGHKADKWRTSGGHMADTSRTRIEGAAKTNNTRRTEGGHVEETHAPGHGQGVSPPAFFPKKEPHSKLLGEKTSKQINVGFLVRWSSWTAGPVRWPPSPPCWSGSSCPFFCWSYPSSRASISPTLDVSICLSRRLYSGFPALFLYHFSVSWFHFLPVSQKTKKEELGTG